MVVIVIWLHANIHLHASVEANEQSVTNTVENCYRIEASLTAIHIYFVFLGLD